MRGGPEMARGLERGPDLPLGRLGRALGWPPQGMVAAAKARAVEG